MLHTPFSNFSFSNKTCYLSGELLTHTSSRQTVFPKWLQDHFDLYDKPFRQLNEQYTTYGNLSVPVAEGLRNEVLEPFEAKIQKAFSAGYELVAELTDQELFQWFGKLMYGIVFNEIQTALREKPAGEPLSFSSSLIQKFSNHLRFVQSLFVETEFEDFHPYSIVLTRVKPNEAPIFDYRNEMNTLVVSLQMNDFGLVICMQDNGENARLHRPLTDLIAGETLHPIQFQELAARFYYSAYLFNRLPEYIFLSPPNNDQKQFISAMPLHLGVAKSLFDPWKNRTYAQVLEAFWKPWGIVLFEILKDPENPMSFITGVDGLFIEHPAIPA